MRAVDLDDQTIELSRLYRATEARLRARQEGLLVSPHGAVERKGEDGLSPVKIFTGALEIIS